MRLLLFMIDENRYGIAAESAYVEIVRAVAITPLPNAPAVISGVIDVRGTVLPVFDLRRRFGLLARDVALTDHFIIVRASRRSAVLHVDTVLDLVDVDDDALSTLAGELPPTPHVAGVATLADGLAVIHDVDTFLSQAEEDLSVAVAHRISRCRQPAVRIYRRQSVAVRRVAGVATLADGLAVIHDVDTCLSQAEEEHLENAMASRDGIDAPRSLGAR